MEGGWTTKEVRDFFGLSLWKDIRKGWEEFILRTSIRIRNGRHTSFWWDNWVGDSKLKDIFLLHSGLQPTNLLQCRPFEEARGWRWLLGGAFEKIFPKLGIGGGDLFFRMYFCAKGSRRGGFFSLEE